MTQSGENTIQSFDEADFWLPYQCRWLNDFTQIKFAEKGRREGFTYVQAYEDVRDCVTKRYFRPGRPLSVWFTSTDLTAAKEYIRYCQEFAELFNSVAVDLGEQIIDEKNGVKAFCIEFKNGARIYALSSNPSQFRSKGGKVIIDEFAHHEQQQELWKAAYASAKIWGYPIRVISTHKGTKTLFYKFIQKIKAGKLKHSLHTVPIELAVEEGLADKICQKKLTKEERKDWLREIREDCGDEQTYLEEFCCIAVDSADALLSYELIESCVGEDVKKPLNEITDDYYVGFDVARKKDLSVIAGDEYKGEVHYIRQLEEMLNQRFRNQREILYKHLEHKTFRRSGIDSTGIGAQIAEDAQIDYGTTKVEDVTFTAAIKEALAFKMLRVFQDRNIRIPDDEALKQDLHSIRKITTETGHIRFDAERTETDGHGDRFWAIALAINSVTEKSTSITSVRTSGKRESEYILNGYI